MQPPPGHLCKIFKLPLLDKGNPPPLSKSTTRVPLRGIQLSPLDVKEMIFCHRKILIPAWICNGRPLMMQDPAGSLICKF